LKIYSLDLIRADKDIIARVFYEDSDDKVYVTPRISDRPLYSHSPRVLIKPLLAFKSTYHLTVRGLIEGKINQKPLYPVGSDLAIHLVQLCDVVFVLLAVRRRGACLVVRSRLHLIVGLGLALIDLVYLVAVRQSAVAEAFQVNAVLRVYCVALFALVFNPVLDHPEGPHRHVGLVSVRHPEPVVQDGVHVIIEPVVVFGIALEHEAAGSVGQEVFTDVSSRIEEIDDLTLRCVVRCLMLRYVDLNGEQDEV
jgi:hypothetical protein